MSEWTIEANPADITEAKAEAWLNAGFNRVSIGAQTISPHSCNACIADTDPMMCCRHVHCCGLQAYHRFRSI